MPSRPLHLSTEHLAWIRSYAIDPLGLINSLLGAERLSFEQQVQTTIEVIDYLRTGGDEAAKLLLDNVEARQRRVRSAGI